MNHNLDKEVEECVEAYAEKYGKESLCDLLKQRLAPSDQTITIIVDEGIHNFPSELIKGEKFVFSSGSLDAENPQNIVSHIESSIKSLTTKLKSRKWKKIYLVPSGHPVLSMQVKLLVFRITRIETTDYAYFGEKGYIELDIKQRNLIESS